MLFMPIIVLFYKANGLAMKDVLLLQSIYSLVIVILEIPSGYFADIWGRKNTILIGSIFGTIGFGIYSFSYEFWGFLFAEIALGVGQSFISGADSALLYDTLISQKKEKQYLKLEGRLLSLGNFAEATAAIFGGLLAEISLRHPFYFQTAVAFLAIPAAFMLIEPSRHRLKKNKYSNIRLILVYSFLRNKALRWNIVFSAMIGAATLTMAWFAQPYMKSLGYDPYEIGILWSLLNLTVGITAITAYKLERISGPLTSTVLIVSLISGSFILISFLDNYWGIALLFLFYLTRGYATPVLKDYINRITPSSMRATILSIRNFVIRIIFAISAPFMGWIADVYSLSTALFIAGISCLVICGLTAILFYLSNFKLKKND